MKLTPFGETVRVLRIRYDVSMKEMADFMGISSSHLSGIEYGEKRLSQKHIDSAIAFFRGKATADEIEQLRKAGGESKDVVHTGEMAPDARGLVAAFARRLQAGDKPPTAVEEWALAAPTGKEKRRK